MVTSNFGDAMVFADILQDWFHFLGGKPGEVVVVDCGSNRETQDVYWKLFQEGIIDKLQVIQSDHEDNAAGMESGYIKEYTSGAIASKKYLLFFHIDTLPYRNGHDDWLNEAINCLERNDVFAIGGSFNLPSKHHDAWPGWYFSHKCSLNFALMKRSIFMSAVHELAGPYILSGFKGNNPCKKTNQDRYLLEVAFETYIRLHDMYTLCKIEDKNWTVFHTNSHEDKLRKVREEYFARKDIDRYMNCGLSDMDPDSSKALYYGQAAISPIKRLRIAFGRSPMGPVWRKIKPSFIQLINRRFEFRPQYKL